MREFCFRQVLAIFLLIALYSPLALAQKAEIICPAGTHLEGTTCVKDTVCPLGTTLSGGVCVPIRSTCACPAGSIVSPDNASCIKTTQVAPLTVPPELQMGVGDKDTSYYTTPVALVHSENYAGQALKTAPALATFTGAATSPAFTTAGYAPVSTFTGNVTLPYSSIPVTSPVYAFLHNRMSATNAVGGYNVATSMIAVRPIVPWQASFNQFYGMSVCVNIPTTKSYTIHIGGDNYWRSKLDGTNFIDASGGQSNNFMTGLFVSQTLKAGLHHFEISASNLDSYRGLWFEILDNSVDTGTGSLWNATAESNLNKIYSTRNLVATAPPYDATIPFSHDINRIIPGGKFFGPLNAATPVCPAGYEYNASPNACGSAQTCVKIERLSCLTR